MMPIPPHFEELRPYRDEEIPAAMQRIAASEHFPLLAAYIYPECTVEEVRARICAFRTIRDFQLDTMHRVNREIIARSTTAFTYSGFERLDPQQRYLFVSNHRDILLDACLLQYILHEHGHPTTEITFGANLMSTQLLVDIGKSNKMFRTERGGDLKQFYHHARCLSEYIRYTITEKRESVWIAQRNGRTKDGCDATDQGIVKMFLMSWPDDRIEALAELQIVPVAVSYEWESCDVLKATELCKSRTAKYVKAPDEDLQSILTGILQPKGRVHIACCNPVTRDDLKPFAGLSGNEFNKHVAALLDERIRAAYVLTPNNYIAHDMRSGSRRFADRYTEEERRGFAGHLARAEAQTTCDPAQLREILLGIYANPVDSKYGE